MKRLITVILLSAFIVSSFGQEEKPGLENPMSVDYLKKNVRKDHPRLVYTKKSIKQVRKKLDSDPVVKNMYAAIKLNADEIYDQALLERNMKGKRLLSVSREFLYRINILGFIYLMEEDQKALDRINEEVIAVCSFSDWNPRHFLDVGEMALGVALALDWTKGELPAATIALAKNALRDKALKPSWPADGRRWHTAYSSNNWNQVCAGGLIAASITLAEDEAELASKTIHRALEGLPNALWSYAPDGVYPEGSTYWQYGTSYSVVTIGMFESAFGTDFGHYEYPGFKESAMFRTLCNAPSGMYYNFFDCSDQRSESGDIILAWFAMKSSIPTYFERERFLSDPAEMGKLSRLMGIAMAWLSAYEENNDIIIPEAWKGEGENPIVILSAPENDPHQFYLGCKGGSASLSHANMDAGSFVFELNGIRWSVDPGRQDYNTIEQTGFDLWGRGQDADRWTLLSKNNFGHSTITVNNQPFIVNEKATLFDFNDSETPAASFDLSPVYGGNITSLHRSFLKESTSSLLIEDKIELSENTRSITWQLMTQADVEIVNDGAILRQDGKELKLTNLSHPEIKVSVISLDPPPLKLDRRIDGLKRLEIRIPAWIIEKGTTKLQVRLSEY